MKEITKTLLRIIPIILVILGVAYYVNSRKPEPVFNVEDWSAKLNFAIPQNYSGAIVTNLDADPAEEILVAAINGPNLIFEYHEGKLEVLKNPLLENAEGYTQAIIPCDLDGNGRDELILLNKPVNEESKSLFLSFKDGSWVSNSNISEEAKRLLANANSGTCIDRSGTGKYGLALTRFKGAVSFLEFNNQKLEDISNEVGLGLISDGQSISGIPGPRGFTNLFVATDKENFYFVNDGKGNFTEQAKVSGLEDREFETRGSSTLDINHDEIPDLVYGNHFGPLRVLKQDRDGKFKDVTPEELKTKYAVSATVAADLNLDGYEDLYLNNIRNANILLAGNGDEWIEINEPKLKEEDLFGVSTLVGDFDGLPGLEMLNTHGDGHKFLPKLYHIHPIGEWIAISVKLSNGGIPRGAIVRLRSNNRDQLRVISTGTGKFANYTSDLHFGLLPEEKPLSVEVTLPSGVKKDYIMDLKPNQINVLKLTN